MSLVTPFTLPAPAKLNLFLRILGRREDGYHSIQTLFQFLDHCDQLTFATHETLSVECSDPDLNSSDNLVVRAAERLRDEVGYTGGARILLRKKIPKGGGLGGGSSDAATALHGLNRLWDLGLDTDRLASIGLELGTDIPVFVRGQAAFAEGIGERLLPVTLAERWFVVGTPDCVVESAKMYQHPDLSRNSSSVENTLALDAVDGRVFKNDFESLARRLFPKVDKCLLLLDNSGGSGPARLSGSGACCFVPFPSEQTARSALKRLLPTVGGFVAQGLNRSPLHQALERLGG